MSDQQRYKLLLLEDNQIVTQRVADILNTWSKGELIQKCANLNCALEAISEKRPDILIADLNLPDGSGTTAIREFRRQNPDGQAVVLSVLAEGPIVLDAIRAGAVGYILKDDDSLGILNALDMIAEGKSPMSAAIARLILETMHTPVSIPQSEAHFSLTPREIDILNAVGRGFTFKEIAELYGIAVNTVTVHARNIYRKLEAKNRTEAVFEAQKIGLISL
jgi:DNA-binding NarL/FixJ family response regulator